MFVQSRRRNVAMDADNFFNSIGANWNYMNRTKEHALAAAKFCESKEYAFDAASGAGLAFLAGMLEMPDVKLIEPLAAVTHARDIPIKTGGGFVEELTAWAATYGTSASNQYGLMENKNVDIGVVQAEVMKGIWPAFNWAQAMRVAYVDLQKLIDSRKFGIPAPYSLQGLLDTGLRLIWNKALDRVTYLGWGGYGGLMNNSAVTSVQAPLTGTGAGAAAALWQNKTTSQILNDLNTGLITVQQNSGYDTEGIPDTILVDYTHWGILNQPMTIGGFNSLLEYFLANNVAKRQGVPVSIFPLPDPWISTQGVGATSEILYYRKSEASLYLKIPQPIQKVFTMPTVQGAGYETLFMGCIGVPQILRPSTLLYQYGV